MKAMIQKIVLLFLLASTPLYSGDLSIKTLDVEACRELMEAGEILSMSELMRLVSTLSEGKIIDTQLLQKGPAYIYEMEIAAKDGMVSMLYVDARNGMVVDPAILNMQQEG
ncbi:PepSY domain-containing protein [Amphritea sp.]|uniref:PepSY domain-containing protein n=1 Tax=Amphritea sp. TaxID=1872502 RepID=UPI003A8DD792